jgi:hypothetical protein
MKLQEANKELSPERLLLLTNRLRKLFDARRQLLLLFKQIIWLEQKSPQLKSKLIETMPSC